MLRNGIAQFVGSWVSQFRYRLRVEKVRRDRAVVDFLDPRGAPIVRPYMGGAPSMKMIAHYDDYNEDFRVDLWEESEGFILHLDHEYGSGPATGSRRWCSSRLTPYKWIWCLGSA